MKKHKKSRTPARSRWSGAWLLAAFLILLYFDFEVERSLPYIIASVVTVAVLPFVFSSLKARWRKRRYMRSSLYVIDQMTGVEFEEFLKAHFEALGYKVSLTPGSNDYGIDLICRRREGISQETRIAVQAKRYNGKVGVNAVQQVIAGMQYYDCDQGLVVTNSYFTQNAVNLAEKSGVWLWDREEIRKNFKIK